MDIMHAMTSKAMSQMLAINHPYNHTNDRSFSATHRNPLILPKSLFFSITLHNKRCKQNCHLIKILKKTSTKSLNSWPFYLISSSLNSTSDSSNRSDSESNFSKSSEASDSGQVSKQKTKKFQNSFKFPVPSVRESMGERVLGAIVNTSIPPIGSYVSEPVTILHRLDPRVKQAWLLSLVLLPTGRSLQIRFAFVAGLVAVTMVTLPRGMWQDQLSRLFLLTLFLFTSLAIGSDGVPPLVQPRHPPPIMEGLPSLPPPPGGYSYVLFKFWFIQLTRRGLSLAASTACLSFTVLQSTSLCLTTTSPEQLAQGMRWVLRPLRFFSVPVDEIILTLMLSLRFIGLVFEEVRNLALGVVSRGVDWNSLKLLGTIDVLVGLTGRIFENLFSHASKIAQAMTVRRYDGNAEKHKIFFLHPLEFKWVDWYAFIALLILIIAMNFKLSDLINFTRVFK